MKTTVIFLRHAEPSKDGYSETCVQALSQKGMDIQAEQTAILKQKNHSIDKIICSPLKRALETAHIVKKKIPAQITIENALSAPFDPVVLLQHIPDPQENQTILFIGHAPTLAEFAKSLARKSILPYGLSKSGIVILEFIEEIGFKKAQFVEEIQPRI
jgi:phosphohistidine phosphatase SixA